MKLRSGQYYIRKSHRYLGLLLGIQFFFWTLGGLYFSWNDIDEVHGDHLRKEKRHLPANLALISPQQVIESIKQKQNVDSVMSLQLIEVNGSPVYQLRYFSGSAATAHAKSGHHAGNHDVLKVQLADAVSGDLLSPLSKEQAVKVAVSQVADPAKVTTVEYLTEAGPHHEYREKPLPAWAISFSSPAKCTVYVSAELGTFQAIRHDQWRLFDFMWMMHTMDYHSRDNFGNLLLRVFSIFGLITILSGFALYAVSSPSVRKVRHPEKKRQV